MFVFGYSQICLMFKKGSGIVLVLPKIHDHVGWGQKFALPMFRRLMSFQCLDFQK